MADTHPVLSTNLTETMRAEIAADIAVALDEGQSVVSLDTLQSLGLEVCDGWRVELKPPMTAAALAVSESAAEHIRNALQLLVEWPDVAIKAGGFVVRVVRVVDDEETGISADQELKDHNDAIRARLRAALAAL